jgi:hypothetical protein
LAYILTMPWLATASRNNLDSLDSKMPQFVPRAIGHHSVHQRTNHLTPDASFNTNRFVAPSPQIMSQRSTSFPQQAIMFQVHRSPFVIITFRHP